MSEWHERISFHSQGEIFTIDCLIRKSIRARKISLRLTGVGRVVLTLPQWTSLSAGKNFLFQQEKWIRSKSSGYSEPISLSQFYSTGEKIWLDSTPREIICSITSNRKHTGHRVEEDKVKIFTADATDPEIELLEASLLLGREFLPKRLKKCETKSGLKAGKCRVGNQRSRWGSCSTKRTISLNWRILILPYELGDYVLFHELAHLKHMNHSTQFWDFLETLVPHAKKVDRELSRLGKSVFAIGQTVGKHN